MSDSLASDAARRRMKRSRASSRELVRGGALVCALHRVWVVREANSYVERLRARLASLTHEAAPAIVVADQLGLILHVDAELATSLDWRVDQLVDQPLTLLIPPRFRDSHHLGFSRFLTTREPTLLDRAVRLWVATGSGAELQAEHVITGLCIDDCWLFAATIEIRERDAATEVHAG